eukprot:TRINITY_DN19628_c0_g1_i1.p1 TRINITY_DN19628_c0_g1~~TRINITY_DN19628_c0_g1_i1.p1  ORF type:complete len:769 (+),score=169.31 TRINITY_DN19628_c0_g1_i1:84-2309(+)
MEPPEDDEAPGAAGQPAAAADQAPAAAAAPERPVASGPEQGERDDEDVSDVADEESEGDDVDRQLGEDISSKVAMYFHAVQLSEEEGEQLNARFLQSYRRACEGRGAPIESVCKSFARKDLQGSVSVIHSELSAPQIEAIGQAVNENSQIRVVQLKDARLSMSGVQLLLNTLQRTESVTTLALSCNACFKDGAAVGPLAEFLRQSTALRQLTLDECQLGDKGVEALASGLSRATGLRAVNLRMNQIGDRGVLALGNALRDSALEEVLLRNNEFGAGGALAMAPMLGSEPVLCDCQLTAGMMSSGPQRLLPLGLESPHHRWWSCTHCRRAGQSVHLPLNAPSQPVHCPAPTCRKVIGRHAQDPGKPAEWTCATCRRTRGVPVRTEAAPRAARGGGARGCELKDLRLRENPLGDLGLECIGQILRCNTSVKNLELHSTQVGEGGVECLFHAMNPLRSKQQDLPYNKKVTEIDLSANRDGDRIIDMLGDLLQGRVIRALYLRKVSVTEKGMRKFVAHAQRSWENIPVPTRMPRIKDWKEDDSALDVEQPGFQLLHTLDLGDNDVGDGAAALGTILPRLVGLRYLGLRKNNIYPVAAAKLAESLIPLPRWRAPWWNTTLAELDMADNSCGFEGGMTWARVICENRTLRKLQLGEAGMPREVVQELDRSWREASAMGLRRIGPPGKAAGKSRGYTDRPSQVRALRGTRRKLYSGPTQGGGPGWEMMRVPVPAPQRFPVSSWQPTRY